MGRENSIYFEGNIQKKKEREKKNEERNETIEPWEEEKALDDNLGKHLNGYRC